MLSKPKINFLGVNIGDYFFIQRQVIPICTQIISLEINFMTLVTNNFYRDKILRLDINFSNVDITNFSDKNNFYSE